MNTYENAIDISISYENRNFKGYIIACIAIAMAALAIGPWVFSSHWISSSDFHASIEISSSLIALAAGITCLIYFFGLSNRYYLLVGLGFFIAGSEDFVHGILSFTRLFKDVDLDFTTAIPWTYVSGRLLLAIMMIAAPLLEQAKGKATNAKEEAYDYSIVAVVLGGGLTFFAFTLQLPLFIYRDKLISSPIDFIIAILFLIAFVLILKRYIAKRDIFSGWLLLSIMFSFCGEVYMSFSKHFFDSFSDVAHIAKIFSYIMPVMGIALQGLEEMKKRNMEIIMRKQAEVELRKSEERLKKNAHDLEKLNEELRKYDKLKSNFVANVSHEFNQPLTIIKGSLELLLDGSSGELNPSQIDFLERTKKTVDRLRRLVTDLLDLSKIETGKMEIKHDKTDLASLINEILKTYEIEFSRKKLALKTDIAQNVQPILADRDKLSQVFINLLNNAIKFTPEGGTITVKSMQTESEARFEISDTGHGIAEEYYEKIFDKFERITAEKQEGTGLGLPIAKDIVNLHGGRIWVESKIGKGSKFIVILPKNLGETK
ncbi:MAG: ATP-binding protein [Pseudomonadota bacterium]